MISNHRLLGKICHSQLVGKRWLEVARSRYVKLGCKGCKGHIWCCTKIILANDLVAKKLLHLLVDGCMDDANLPANTCQASLHLPCKLLMTAAIC